MNQENAFFLRIEHVYVSISVSIRELYDLKLLYSNDFHMTG
jgi:hypothetical protein